MGTQVLKVLGRDRGNRMREEEERGGNSEDAKC